MSNAIPTSLALSMPAGWEWIVILIVAVIIFGKRLPEVARNLGRSISDFKKGLKETTETKDANTGQERHRGDADVTHDAPKQ